ncbi:MAG: hypothetical protein ACI4UN_00150, partial [Muribaculaceae bacterium]
MEGAYCDEPQYKRALAGAYDTPPLAERPQQIKQTKTTKKLNTMNILKKALLYALPAMLLA